MTREPRSCSNWPRRLARSLSMPRDPNTCSNTMMTSNSQKAARARFATCCDHRGLGASIVRILALEPAARVEARSLTQLLVELLLALRERVRHHDVQHRVKVARAAVGLGQPFPREAELLATLGSGRHFHAYLALQRRDLDLGAERGLPRRHRHLDVEVVAAHAIQRVRIERD